MRARSWVVLSGVVVGGLFVGAMWPFGWLGGDDAHPAGESAFWDSFPDGVQQAIDAGAAAGDCANLQAIFDTYADQAMVESDAASSIDTDDVVLLLEYTHGKLQTAGCYPGD